jgi:nucleoside 2-deoxyribosyltransferase
MDIYFSCSLTGGRSDQPVYAALVRHMQDLGHHVLTAHLADLDVMAQDAQVDAASVYARDLAWLEACDALIAEVTTPSHGVGFEIATAIALGKPALCLHRTGARVSKMIAGCPDPGLEMAAYENEAEALARVGGFLRERAG